MLAETCIPCLPDRRISESIIVFFYFWRNYLVDFKHISQRNSNFEEEEAGGKQKEISNRSECSVIKFK